MAGLVGGSAISLGTLVQDNRLVIQINELVTHLSLARSEAIKRRVTVTLCKSNTGVSCNRDADWQSGWIIFTDPNTNRVVDADEDILLVQSALDGNPSMRFGETGRYNYVTYYPTGYAWPNATFTLCDGRGSDRARAVILYWTGRPRTSLRNSSGGALRCPG